MKKILLISILAASALMAESFSWVKSVKVIRSEPTYRTVTIRTPVEECWDEDVPVSNNNNGPVGGLIGGAAGGILGHQVGRGGGRTAATIGGAIIGTLVGNNLSQNNNRGPAYRTERRCRTHYKEHTANRFIGYKNYARYKGREIIKYSDRPLHRIDITVTVSY